jgi:hypothetical protein
MDVLTFETCCAVNSEIIKKVISSWSVSVQLCLFHSTVFDVQYNSPVHGLLLPFLYPKHAVQHKIQQQQTQYITAESSSVFTFFRKESEHKSGWYTVPLAGRQQLMQPSSISLAVQKAFSDF